MKKLLLYIVLFAYTAFLQKPAIPFLKDFINHTFFYAKHLAVVHKENGKYHVHVEVAQNMQDERKENSNTSSFPPKDNTTTDHLTDYTNDDQLFSNYMRLNYLLPKVEDVIKGFTQKIFLPPRS
ncbi:MAG: hypothetical protein IT255_12395 [Chitinophagaceae bacterium]|nr:hypothetical protein [Chitinophagaceae bacterium]